MADEHEDLGALSDRELARRSLVLRDEIRENCRQVIIMRRVMALIDASGMPKTGMSVAEGVEQGFLLVSDLNATEHVTDEEIDEVLNQRTSDDQGI